MGKIVSKVNKTGKRPLTDMEKACIVYGYVRRMAEESKEDGLFADHQDKGCS